MIITPKYKKRLNKNGWMASLHRLCFGKHAPNFMGYCPFFWFTWLCVLFFPIFLIGRGIGITFGALVAYCDSVPRSPRRPPNEKLLEFYLHYIQTVEQVGLEDAMSWERQYNQATFHRVFAWIDATPDWENCAKRVLLRHQKSQQRKEARSVQNDKRVKALSSVAGYIVKPIVVFLGLFVSYGIVKVTIFLISAITVEVLIGAAIVTGFVLLALVIIYFVTFIVSLFRKCPKKPEEQGFFYKLFLPLAVAIEAGGEFIIDTISAFYKQECPLIEWGESTHSIESNLSDS